MHLSYVPVVLIITANVTGQCRSQLERPCPDSPCSFHSMTLWYHPLPRRFCDPPNGVREKALLPGSCHTEVTMSRTLRNILIAVGVLVVILIVVPFLIPVNHFRPMIEERASASLGRKVQVGDLSLSLLRGALTAKDLSIGDDPKFSPSPFVTAKSLSVGVEMLPLIFSKQLNVTGITIDEPQVTLLKNPAGDWNYSSIGGSNGGSPGAAAKAETKQAPAGASGGSADISVKKLEL